VTDYKLWTTRCLPGPQLVVCHLQAPAGWLSSTRHHCVRANQLSDLLLGLGVLLRRLVGLGLRRFCATPAHAGAPAPQALAQRARVKRATPVTRNTVSLVSDRQSGLHDSCGRGCSVALGVSEVRRAGPTVEDHCDDPLHFAVAFAICNALRASAAEGLRLPRPGPKFPHMQCTRAVSLLTRQGLAGAIREPVGGGSAVLCAASCFRSVSARGDA
jgi:hypothetical protein